MLIKTPPYSLEGEQAVLGGLLIDGSAWDRVADIIDAGDFYRQDHRLIFEAVARLVADGKPVDAVTVAESLDKSGLLGKTGGMPYLTSLSGNTASAANIRRYAEIVRDHATLRSLIEVSSGIVESACFPSGRSAAQLLDEAEAGIFRLAEGNKRKATGFLELKPLLHDCMERIDHLHYNGTPDGITGVPTGFVDLDKMTAGLQPGDLIVVAGRPSMGKTSFALNIAEHIALELGLPVGIFSMEMGAQQLVMRMLGSVGRIDSNKLRTGKGMEDEDWSKLTYALGRLNDSAIFIDETAALTTMEVRAKARRLMRRAGGKLGLVVVDYLQLMSSQAGTGRSETRAAEVSEISRNLKALAKEIDCPVIALSQLNRALEQRHNKRPVMSDLRESGSIEQDADVIVFIYRDEVYDPDTQNRGVAEIIVAKQRNGPTGTVHLAFLGQYTRFENLAHFSRNGR